MKIVLFDDIHENHVRRSLSRALRARGHTVVETQPVWRGHRLPVEASDIEHIRQEVDTVIGLKPDALLNFRASSLTPEMLKDIRAAGIKTAVWFPDDPVLYDVCYRLVVEHYDIVLNCGSREVLEFYEFRHGVHGFNFPFWTDRIEFPRTHDAVATPEFDIGFLGTFKGPARSTRYQTLASLPFKVKAFGEIKEDPAGIGGGYLRTPQDVADTLAKARIGFNMPQVFSDYHGHAYDFPELARLGSFEFASRVIQYMAIGLPVATLGKYRAPKAYPEMLVAPDIARMTALLRQILSDPEKLQELSTITAARFDSAFSADARAALFEALCEEPGLGKTIPVEERSQMFANMNGVAAEGSQKGKLPRDVDGLPSIEEQKACLSQQRFEAKKKYNILHIGTFTQGSTDVVACLYRSLQNVGHNVHHVDFRDEPDILVEPGGLISGYGPVYVNHQEVLRHAKDHLAQIVVCNAAGLCFSPEAAQELRNAGLVLVGITLSDPDVQDSIIDHVENFDLHFTNSRHALKRYIERGIKNTFYLPFAVDLGWILTDVPSNSKFAADIICLGHAVNRPDRIETMQRVWDSFSNVRTYGKGWPFPGSGDVRGLDLLQASRGGKLHINFPLTRAGFINVKCGVFETVGSGAVLLTGIFPELGELFEYDTEIVGYSSTEDLVEKIRGLLANPDEIERIRRRGFARLISSHLYEHRWLSVFDRLEEALEGKIEIFEETRRKKLVKELRWREKRPVQVGITGFYGHGNLGDELILSSILKRAREERPDLEFTVFTTSPGRVQDDFRIRAVRLDDDDGIKALLGKMDAAILGGGGLWHDYTFERAGGPMALFRASKMSMGGYARASFMIAATGAPFHVYGLGVGPLNSSPAREFAKFMSRQIETITVRDPGSAELLKSIPGWEKEVRVAPDMVYAYPIEAMPSVPEIDAVANGLPVMLINVRPWAGIEMGPFLENLGTAISNVLKDKPHALVGLPMQEGETHDRAALSSLFDKIDASVSRTILDWRGKPEVALAAINRADAVVAMRLHACLLAHRMEVPTLGFAYDPKLNAHFLELGRGDYCLPLSSSAASIESSLRQVLTSEGQLSVDQKSHLKSLAEHARRDMQWLLHQLPKEARLGPIAQIRSGGERINAPRVDEAKITVNHVLLEPLAPAGCMHPRVAIQPIEPKGVRFVLDEAAPKKGQAAGLSIILRPRHRDTNGFQVALRSTYSRIKNVGYLSYVVLLDGQVLAKEKFGYSAAENVISVHAGKPVAGKKLEIRIVADQDCPEWNWNLAVALELRSLNFMMSHHVGNVPVVGASSPWTEVRKPWPAPKLLSELLALNSNWAPRIKRGAWQIRKHLRNYRH